MTTKDKLALIVSTITSPFLVMAVFGLWTIKANTDSLGDFWFYNATFIVCIVLLPLLVILSGIINKTITDLHINLRKQRSLPFMVATLGSVLLIGSYFYIAAPSSLLIMSIVIGVNGVLFYLLTAYWKKVSIHAASYTGAVIMISYLIDPIYFVLLLGLPLISWARMHRKRHDVTESIAAVIMVSLITWAAIILLNRMIF